MAVVGILQYPDPRLKKVGDVVKDVHAPEVQAMIADMFETLYAEEHCAGLASTQLDFAHPKQITVIDFSEEKDQPLCLVNPEIIAREGETNTAEGCMSVSGGAYEKVKRAERITVRYVTKDGKTVEATHDAFMAKCIQHEVDHLNGKLFIEHLSRLKQSRIHQKILKVKKR
jgi:peptide deformylase